MMGLIRTEHHFRRGVNLLPALLIPGSAQLLAGKRARGILGFLSVILCLAAVYALEFHPETRFEHGRFEWIDGVLIGAWLVVFIDGICWRIPRQGPGPWLAWLVIVTLFYGGSHLFTAKVIESFLIPNDAMFPTLTGPSAMHPGDQVWVDKRVYNKTKPQRGDVVAFTTQGINHPQAKPGHTWVKRIIGLPGEAILWEPPNFTINNALPEDPLLLEMIAGKDLYSGMHWPKGHPLMPPAINPETPSIILGENEYFVIGDNQEDNFDSRYFGPLNGDNIFGKVVYIAAPALRKGPVR